MAMVIRFNNFVLTNLKIANMIGHKLETDLIHNWVKGTLICEYMDDVIFRDVLLDLPMFSISDFEYCQHTFHKRHWIDLTLDSRRLYTFLIGFHNAYLVNTGNTLSEGFTKVADSHWTYHGYMRFNTNLGNILEHMMSFEPTARILEELFWNSSISFHLAM